MFAASTHEEIVEYLNAHGIQNETYNVGCMYWNYEPVTLDEIIHHGKTIRPNYGMRCTEERVIENAEPVVPSLS